MDGNGEVRETMGQGKGLVGSEWERVKESPEGRVGKGKGMVGREGRERVRRW